MTPKRFEQVLTNFRMTKSAAARFLDVDVRTVRRWSNGYLEIPKIVAMLLELMVKTHKKPDQVG